MPGDDLLFQRLSVSTIGADWFHGRVRDGIGWDTDAMVTRQWSGRAFGIRSMVWDLAGIVLAVTVGSACCRVVGEGVDSTSMMRVIRTG